MNQLLPARSMAAANDAQIARSVDTKARELTILASTRAVDGFGTIILPEAFRAGMADYMKNPVILKNHDRRGDVVAKTLSWQITDQGLEKRVKFAPTSGAMELFQLYAEGYMRSWSVGGGVPLKARLTNASSYSQLAALPGYARQALQAGAAQEVYTEFILRETSAVTIGANPDALTKAARDGLITMSAARSMYAEAVRAMPAPWVAKEKAKVAASIDISRRFAAMTPVQRLTWEVLCMLSPR